MNMKSYLRRLAIALNGAPVSRVQQTSKKDAPRTVCLPSNGGLNNQDWKWTQGADLQHRFSQRNLGDSNQ